jgi:hypothetical protein
MKLRIDNLGILYSADLEIGDLTVICGKNNTGKTYATYAIYGLLRSWRRLSQDILPRVSSTELAETGKTTIDLSDVVLKRWNSYCSTIAKRFQASLPSVLAADYERFTNTRLQITIPPPQNIRDIELDGIKGNDSNKSSGLLSYKKEKDSFHLTFSLLSNDRDSLSNRAVTALANELLQDLFFAPAFPTPFMASTERTGAAIFQGELNFSRTRILEALASSVKNNSKVRPQDILPAVLNEFDPRYALPVQDNVDFVNRLGSLSHQKSELAVKHPDLLADFQNIIGGEYKVSRNAVSFVPKKTRTKLSLGESSSAVRSLLDVGFYLQHQAKTGDLLMIDEPELNLHPENQRLITRLLTRIVNSGIKVLITTHSDYIAKEINILSLLDKHPNPTLLSELGYHTSECISGSRINVFITHKRDIKKSESARRTSSVNVISKVPPLIDGGFDWPSFDTTIEDQNHSLRKIFDLLD